MQFLSVKESGKATGEFRSFTEKKKEKKRGKRAFCDEETIIVSTLVYLIQLLLDYATSRFLPKSNGTEAPTYGTLAIRRSFNKNQISNNCL